MVRLHRFAFLAMLLPFVLLSALPAGFMPGRSDSGTLTLVLCTADGPQEMTIDLGTGQTPPDTKACPWAIAHAAVALPGGPATLAAPTTLVRVEPVRDHDHIRPIHLPEHGAARAPPALA